MSSETTVLQVLKENNEYPLLFIGSGISRRYLVNSPGWSDLLEIYWKELNQEQEFYAYLNTVRDTIKEQDPDLTEDDLNYYTNIQAGTEIEKLFNDLYYKGKITIENFSSKEAYRQNLSPFKKALANKFSSYEINQELHEELNIFKKVLNKAQIILTTNYDTFIEDAFDSLEGNGIKKYIGQKGFFEQTYDWAEIYKLHGCSQEPDSIVISSQDYDKFEKNSILISAKIISMLINSPIIFLGYSLTDLNIRKIILDFSSSLTPFDINKMGSRIIIVEWERGQQEIIEQRIFDKNLNCEYTLIKTDNYIELYKQLIEINQGVSPWEVRRYQHVIKKLIVDNGKKGSLQTILIAPEDIDELEQRTGEGNLVVAIGDTTYIFRMPDLISYIYDYVFEIHEIHTDIALRFVANLNLNSRIPFLDRVKGVEIEKTNLNPSEKERIRQRIDNNKDVDKIINTVPTFYKTEMPSLSSILEEGYKDDKEMEIISYNAKRVDFSELDEYVKKRVSKMKNEGIARPSTAMRRLLFIYDFLRQSKRS